VAAELLPQPLALELPAFVKSAGFVVADHAQIIGALAGLAVEGVPERAVDKRRAEFLAGRFAALEALRALGVAELPGRNDDGSPRWPAEIVGSITHGAERALCCVARRSQLRGLGIDVERLMNDDVKLELRRRICSQTELALGAEQLPLLRENELVSVAFSAKESLYKCLYPAVGRFMDFHAARLVGAAAHATASHTVVGQLTLELAVDWSSSFRAGQRLTVQFHKGTAHVETAAVLPA
jgi:enterobactin synthetase component D